MWATGLKDLPENRATVVLTKAANSETRDEPFATVQVSITDPPPNRLQTAMVYESFTIYHHLSGSRSFVPTVHAGATSGGLTVANMPEPRCPLAPHLRYSNIPTRSPHDRDK